MNTTKTVPAHPSDLLTVLRSFATEDHATAAQMLHVADEQAQVLLSCLDVPITQIPARLAQLFPNLAIHYKADIPMPVVSFWGKDKRWHIHLRATDPARVQAYALLHQLKHIIDHPVRNRVQGLNESSWEELANHFAHLVLEQDHVRMTLVKHNRYIGSQNKNSTRMSYH